MMAGKTFMADFSEKEDRSVRVRFPSIKSITTTDLACSESARVEKEVAQLGEKKEGRSLTLYFPTERIDYRKSLTRERNNRERNNNDSDRAACIDKIISSIDLATKGKK